MPITMKSKWYCCSRLFVFIQPEEINDAFSYKLCTRPASLFDKKGLINEAHKPALKNLLYDQHGLKYAVLHDFPRDTHNINDGGSILQRIPWVFGSTYWEICQTYIHYLLNHYGTGDNITVMTGDI